MEWKIEDGAEIYYDKEAVEKITKDASSYIANQLKDIMEREKSILKKNLRSVKFISKAACPVLL